MSHRATTEDPLQTMRGRDPVDVHALRAELDPEAIGAALARAIGAAGLPRDPVPAGDAFAAGLEPRRRHAARPLALAGALALLILGALAIGGVFSGGGAHPTYAAAAIEVAEANPRLLVTAPGWEVTEANEFEADYGDTTFGDGRRTLELHWYPARFYRRYLRDRAEVSPPRHSRLLGRAATTVEYGHRGDYATMIAPIGAVFVEVRGRLGGHAAYEKVLHSLRAVDVDTWLAAMPASVVSPGARPHTVAAMLRGVPYPPGFDPARLKGETAVLSHYSLGVQVADAVACGWVESWLAARAAGDRVAARDAVEAMASSHHWPLLLRMAREVKRRWHLNHPHSAAEFGWSQNIWHAAAELRRGHLHQDFDEALVRPDGSGYRVGPAWATELQCTARIRRVPFKAGEAPGEGG